MSELLDARELADRLRVTPDTIHAWHRRGWIPCLRAGRRPVLFDPAAVERLSLCRKRACERASRRSGGGVETTPPNRWGRPVHGRSAGSSRRDRLRLSRRLNACPAGARTRASEDARS